MDTVEEVLFCAILGVIGFAIMIAIHLFLEERKEEKKNEKRT
jgi:hypothetical protein